MRYPVSTLREHEQVPNDAMRGGSVDVVIHPCTLGDAQPCFAQGANGVRMVAAAISGLGAWRRDSLSGALARTPGRAAATGPSGIERRGGTQVDSKRSTLDRRRVNCLVYRRSRNEHGLLSPADDRFVASADRPAPRATPSCARPASIDTARVVQWAVIRSARHDSTNRVLFHGMNILNVASDSYQSNTTCARVVSRLAFC